MKAEKPLDIPPEAQEMLSAAVVGSAHAAPDFEDDRSLIALLETFRPYDPFSNAIPAEIWTAWTFRVLFAVISVGAVVIAACVWSKRHVGYTPGFLMPLADNTFHVMLLAAGLMIIAYPLFYLMRHPMRDDDRTRHLSGEYVHRMKQLKALCAYPFDVLKSVASFHDNRPAGLQGFMGPLMGSGVATLATLGGCAGLIKLLVDDRPGYGLAVIVGILFVFLAAVTALSRLSLSRADYRQSLLKEALVIVEGASSGSPQDRIHTLGPRSMARNEVGT